MDMRAEDDFSIIAASKEAASICLAGVVSNHSNML